METDDDGKLSGRLNRMVRRPDDDPQVNALLNQSRRDADAEARYRGHPRLTRTSRVDGMPPIVGSDAPPRLEGAVADTGEIPTSVSPAGPPAAAPLEADLVEPGRYTVTPEADGTYTWTEDLQRVIDRRDLGSRYLDPDFRLTPQHSTQREVEAFLRDPLGVPQKIATASAVSEQGLAFRCPLCPDFELWTSPMHDWAEDEVCQAIENKVERHEFLVHGIDFPYP